jgi:hypothetical protein
LLLVAFCKEAHFNTEHEQLCIDLSILNSNILVRLTSNNTRAIQLSDIVHTYTKFDERMLPLLRLFRILSQVNYFFPFDKTINSSLDMQYWSAWSRYSPSDSFSSYGYPFSSTTWSTYSTLSSRICKCISSIQTRSFIIYFHKKGIRYR